MNATIACLPGDGIGPEVTREAVKILSVIAEVHGHAFGFPEHPMGGIAIDTLGSSLPDASLAACREADAVFMGAVGGPKWDDPNAADRPENGILALRKGLELFANLRPVRVQPQLVDASTIKADVVRQVDLVVIRELTGGIYFGPRQESDAVESSAYDTMLYSAPEIERVVRFAADLARSRSGRLASVDKANVLASSRLWRRVATRVLEGYADLHVDHVLVDAMAMHLIRSPGQYDVIVCSNLFGDILTDEASMLAGSMGMLPSASLGERLNSLGRPLGLYEPIHGSAPDIAGQDRANPLAGILSCALLCRLSLGLDREADAIEAAVDRVLAEGVRTPDIAETGTEVVTTAIMGDLVAAALRA
ncbi:MAG: 3-isopropylmalate dehydrogenase [Caldilineaceae bacterium SB0662_bin_9]|uniref:3-isopropylmalate dehydrogenase n=1 Tax=Caldilineaceae bacterium SB0662_bin_9 TaxID=2605258 RepID=A0A6B1DX81_9CHLR|nr:3-isopropylmalate dehydrogenase [Caldilineaceae bacterium]MXZ41680.1 3-isopropylmalate dehydrogenase [Caldilineaceae bacterium SB0666_bin_21]MYD90974.1 3-isopropylmalate dehydrogenase [Caldilineaceae bacterium SB0662_bin_9]